MAPALSLYLDLVRFLAAFAVFLAHLSSRPFTEQTVWWRLAQYSNVAVVVFFVLSGFVIAHVTSTRETTARGYFAARGARLYSVVLIALALTFALDAMGQRLHPDFYTLPNVMPKPPSLDGYLASMLFVNEFEALHFGGIAPGSNGPYWSLSFEAVYYLVAGIAVFCRPMIAVPAVLVVLALAGRTITALLPIWALGYLLYRARFDLSRRVAMPLALLSGATLLVTPSIVFALPADNFGVWFPWGRLGENRNLIGDYTAALVFGVHLLAVKQWLSTAAESRLVRWLGSLTFPLYCLHYPVMCALVSVSPWARASRAHLAFVVGTTMVLVIAVTPACEALKNRLRRAWAGSDRTGTSAPRPTD